MLRARAVYALQQLFLMLLLLLLLFLGNQAFSMAARSFNSLSESVKSLNHYFSSV